MAEVTLAPGDFAGHPDHRLRSFGFGTRADGTIEQGGNACNENFPALALFRPADRNPPKGQRRCPPATTRRLGAPIAAAVPSMFSRQANGPDVAAAPVAASFVAQRARRALA
ncbi:hypothetical protein [Streptomyces sp. NPDC059008]|uniref:hypothetical protein n=1 Tax=Streptomyces sp. NPDC059008 TaxID=3346693 RepID=UPI0036CC3B1C